MKVLRLRFWANEEESGKSGTWVLSRTGPINFFKERFAQIRPVLRETQGSLNTIFSDLLLRLSSKSQLQSQIRLALVEILLEMYFLVDQVDWEQSNIVMGDYICYLISLPSNYKRRACIMYWETIEQWMIIEFSL